MNDYAAIADLYDAYVTEARDLSFWRWCAETWPGPILELTAGTGRATVGLANEGRAVVSLDLSHPMLPRLSRRFAAHPRPPRPVCGDAASLPFPGGCFGLVVIPFNSLGEITDPDRRREAMAEARRVLAPGGRLVVTLHNPAVCLRTLDGQERLLGTRRLEEVRVRGELVGAGRARSHQNYWVIDQRGEMVERLFGDYDPSAFAAERSPFMLRVLRPAAGAR